MKNFYIDNFVLRILFCCVGFLLIWLAVRFIMSTLIFHEPFSIGPMHIIIPIVLGVVEAVVWKPKNQ